MVPVQIPKYKSRGQRRFFDWSFLKKLHLLEERLTRVGPEVGFQMGRLGVDLLAA